MSTCRQLTGPWLYAFVLTLMLCRHASGAPSVLFSVNDLGGGVFQYNLFVDNRGGSEPLSGLNVLNGNSVFDLDASSVIGPPPNWSFLPPLPPLIDDLDFFSVQSSADVQMGGVLGGFFFQSTLDPSVVRSSGFAVEGIGERSASQIPLGNAQLVPEPSSVLFLSVGITGVALLMGRRTPGGGHGGTFWAHRRNNRGPGHGETKRRDLRAG